MRTVFNFIALLLTVLPLSAQTSPELHARYGEPNEERFSIRPGISFSAEYGSDQAVCRVLIKPVAEARPRTQPRPRPNNTELQSSEEGREVHTELNKPPAILRLPTQVAEDILEEWVPLTSRGEEVGNSIRESGGSRMGIKEYSSVSIARSFR